MTKGRDKRTERIAIEADRSSEPRLSYKVEVTDKDGRVVQREEGPSHSYVRQWNEILHLQAAAIYMGGGGTVKMTDGSTESNAYYSVRSFASNAGIGVDRSGLRVGKNSTPVSINDYALGSPIAQGTGIDQLEHQLTYFTGPVVAGSTLSFTMQRSFVNHSGATISGIQEIGNYIEFTGSMFGRVALGFRDVLGSSFGIPDGGAITVTYTLRVIA
jgi:hypothetical protein